MSFGNFETVFYALAFLVPGFLCDSVISAMVRRRAVAHEISLLRYLTLSCVNYALWSWLVYLIVKSSIFVDRPIRSAVAWGFVILGSPVLLGLILGALSQRNAVRALLARWGIYMTHPIPTAWDYFFSSTGPVWVLVTLTDGSSVAVRFSTRSFASSEANER